MSLDLASPVCHRMFVVAGAVPFFRRRPLIVSDDDDRGNDDNDGNNSRRQWNNDEHNFILCVYRALHYINI